MLGDISYDAKAGRYVAPLGSGRAILTVVPGLQQQLEKVLSDNRVPWGATVLIEPRTGRVLALAEHSQKQPGRHNLSFQALAPAASVFKIVTSAALLERGIGPESEVCYHGGKYRIARANLRDDPRRDHRCITLTSALGHSANVVFAKLADRDLTAEMLRGMADRFFFNAPIPFLHAIDVSPAHISSDPFELATTAAGFGPVRLSPLHAALLASVVANGGLFVPPALVESTEGVAAPDPAQPTRVVDRTVAESLAAMMRTTVTEGTARRAFRDRRIGPVLGDVTVAGKTGSLAEPNPYRDYSWFVGFAPVENPRVAVATVVVNERLWRVRAPYVAREALRAFFNGPWAEPSSAELRRTQHTARR